MCCYFFLPTPLEKADFASEFSGLLGSAFASLWGWTDVSSIGLEYEFQIAVLVWKTTIKQLCHAEHPPVGLSIPQFSPLSPGAQNQSNRVSFSFVRATWEPVLGPL